jgi:hypothetical protein
MGEAKRRGTFDERKALAEEKKASEPPARPVSPYGIRPRGKSRVGLLIAAALAMSARPRS